MSATARPATYLFVVLALVAVLAVTPPAWATPEMSQANQTVPTPTPQGSAPTTNPPAPTEEPSVIPPQGTPEPAGTPAPTAMLALALQASQLAVWPGVAVAYTATLTNVGSSSARDIVLTVVLPSGLTPVPQPTGSGAHWNGLILRAERSVLPPGGRVVVTFSAVVASNAAPGSVLVARGEALAAGLPLVTANRAVALQPAELPRTGGLEQPERGLPSN